MYVLMVSPRMACAVSPFLEGKKTCNSVHLCCIFNVRGDVDCCCCCCFYRLYCFLIVAVTFLSLCQSDVSLLLPLRCQVADKEYIFIRSLQEVNRIVVSLGHACLRVRVH